MPKKAADVPEGMRRVYGRFARWRKLHTGLPTPDSRGHPRRNWRGSTECVNSGRKFPIVPVENSPTQNGPGPTNGRRTTGRGEIQRLPFFHISWNLWNGPERSRARWFCAA